MRTKPTLQLKNEKNVNRLIFEIDTLYDQIGHKQWKNDSKFNFLQSITFKLNYK